MPTDWYRRPEWAACWEAWKAAANEVATLSGEHLPWPYNPEDPSPLARLLISLDASWAEVQGISDEHSL